MFSLSSELDGGELGGLTDLGGQGYSDGAAGFDHVPVSANEFMGMAYPQQQQRLTNKRRPAALRHDVTHQDHEPEPTCTVTRYKPDTTRTTTSQYQTTRYEPEDGEEERGAVRRTAKKRKNNDSGASERNIKLEGKKYATREPLAEVMQRLPMSRVRQHFCFPLKVVAEKMDVSQFTLKRICHKNKILKWPYRPIHGLDHKMSMLEGKTKDPRAVEDLKEQLSAMNARRAAIIKESTTPLPTRYVKSNNVELTPQADGVEKEYSSPAGMTINASGASEPQVTVEGKKSSTRMMQRVPMSCVQQHFWFPLKDAAEKMGVSETTLTRICREYKIPKWPYRQIHDLDLKMCELEGKIKAPRATDSVEDLQEQLCAMIAKCTAIIRESTTPLPTRNVKIPPVPVVQQPIPMQTSSLPMLATVPSANNEQGYQHRMYSMREQLPHGSPLEISAISPQGRSLQRTESSDSHTFSHDASSEGYGYAAYSMAPYPMHTEDVGIYSV